MVPRQNATKKTKQPHTTETLSLRMSQKTTKQFVFQQCWLYWVSPIINPGASSGRAQAASQRGWITYLDRPFTMMISFTSLCALGIVCTGQFRVLCHNCRQIRQKIIHPWPWAGQTPVAVCVNVSVTFQLGPRGPRPVFTDLNLAGSSSGL